MRTSLTVLCALAASLWGTLAPAAYADVPPVVTTIALPGTSADGAALPSIDADGNVWIPHYNANRLIVVPAATGTLYG